MFTKVGFIGIIYSSGSLSLKYIIGDEIDLSKIKQEVIEIEGVKIIMITDGDKQYFPLSQIDQKLLLRQKKSTLPKANKENVKTFNVEYGLITGVTNKQKSKCVESEELKRILEERTQPARLSMEQRLSQNKLHRYFDIPELPIIQYDKDSYSMSSIGTHDSYTQDTIREVLEENIEIEGRLCTNCMKEYPLHETFYNRDSLSAKGYVRVCSKCKSIQTKNLNFKFKSRDENINMLVRNKLDYDSIVSYKNNEIETIYDLYLKGKIKKIPISMRTKENLFIILDSLQESGEINQYNLTNKLLKEKFKLNVSLYENIKLTDIYKRYYGDEFYLEKWKYPEYIFSEIKLTPVIAKTIFSNYIKEYGIKIDDPINFDYQSVIDACTLKGISDIFGGLCGFFVYYWDGKYAGYHFRRIGNYYRIDRNNVLSDLKFLVEKDLNLKVEKIPLYITKNFMMNHCKPLYEYLKKNGHNYYNWFNEIYPNSFDSTDFEITKYRNNFDSVEEEQVDGILREYFDNVVYNYNNSDQTVSLMNKRPDWFIMREDGVWLVEYFGMYLEKQLNNNIIKSYIDGVHVKLKTYENLKGYNFLFVYPSDIEKGFLGLREKIGEIIGEGKKISA